MGLHHVYLTSIQVAVSVRRFTLGPKIENFERLIGHLQAVVDIGQQSQPRQVKMLEFFIVLKCGQCFLSCGRLLELLEHVGLKNSIMNLLRCQVDSFPYFGGGIAHSPCLRQGHAAVEIGPGVLWGTLLGAVEDLYRFEVTSLAQKLDAFSQPGFRRVRARLTRAAGRWCPEQADQENQDEHNSAEFELALDRAGPV